MPIDMFDKRAAQLTVVFALLLAMGGDSLGQAPSPPQDLGEKAFQLEQQGNIAEAEAAWRAVIKVSPTNAEAFAHLGYLESREEHYKDAVISYRRALALNPTLPGLRLNMGLALFKDGSMKAAIQTFEPLLKTAAPSSPEAVRLTTLIGLAHYGLGEYAAAVPYLKQA